jgi:hypothetical protein
MHGGADGSGAPRGSKNGNYKHGRYTAEVAATRRWIREAIQTLLDAERMADSVQTSRHFRDVPQAEVQ